MYFLSLRLKVKITKQLIPQKERSINMCLAVPHKIIKMLDKNRAIASAGPVEVEIRTDIVPDLAIGDMVLVHAGFAIEKLVGTEGEEICTLWEELREVMENENVFPSN